MKKIFPVIALFVSIGCYGQDTSKHFLIDTASIRYKSYYGDSSNTSIITMPSDKMLYNYGIRRSEEKIEYDTIAVIMLVTGIGQPVRYSMDDVPLQEAAYHMTGYEKRRKHCCINGNHSELAYYQPEPYYSHEEWLNTKKQPLDKSVVVWLSMNLQ